MGLLVAKFAQKTFLINISVIPGGHFKFWPLEKMLTSLGGTWRIIFFRNGPWNSIPPPKHTSQRVVTELGYMTILLGTSASTHLFRGA